MRLILKHSYGAFWRKTWINIGATLRLCVYGVLLGLSARLALILLSLSGLNLTPEKTGVLVGFGAGVVFVLLVINRICDLRLSDGEINGKI